MPKRTELQEASSRTINPTMHCSNLLSVQQEVEEIR